jgi:hypothetical protein
LFSRSVTSTPASPPPFDGSFSTDLFSHRTDRPGRWEWAKKQSSLHCDLKRKQARQRAKIKKQRIEMTKAGWRGMKESMFICLVFDDEAWLSTDGRAVGDPVRWCESDCSALGTAEGGRDEGPVVGWRLGYEEGDLLGCV